jgi:hypothetical protein
VTIEWEPSRDSAGKVPMSNHRPLAMQSKDGKYVVCRVSTTRGWASEAWYRESLAHMAVCLKPMCTGAEAIKACEEHVNGHRTETAGV